MIKRFYILLLAIVASVGMSWAAGIPCTAADLGKVLCTDGSIYATVSDATAANKTAVAMIAYIDTENNKGLALALVEEKGNANWSEAISKCEAKTPTVTGGTWKLASEDEWNKMIDAAGSRNALRDGFSAIGGSNLKSDGNDKYWSSTESSNTEKGRCICFNNTFGGWSDASKTTNYPFYARACLAFNIGEPDPTVTVGVLEHGSVVASATTAEAGATITLTATPEAGYKLNTIEATYFGAANETLSVENKKNVGRGITAEYNKSNYLYVSSYDGAYNLTVSTNDGTNLIRKIEIEFYGPGVNDARTNSMLSSDHGSWAFEDGDPCTKATINNINAVSVVLSGSGVGMNKAWFPKTMKVYYDGDVLIDLTDTENANVKTFTMVNKAVNVFAEFIPTGSCGENLTWEYSPSTGALVISGTGAMSDYDNNMNKAPWYAYRESISSISLPDGLTYIGKHAFRECNNFAQLVVPNSVTEIGNTAFQDCSKLWNLTLPNTLEKIGGAAFERTKISNFTIPEGVTSLDGYVFGECTSLYRVNIHAGVTSLTGNVFYNCTNLNTIYCYVENPVAITSAVFEGVNKANCKLYVPFTSMAAYQAADEWKDFFIKPIPGTAPTLYLDIDGASATLIYGYPEDGKPAYNEEYGQWNNLDYEYRNDNLKTLTIDASCRENVMTSFKNLFQYFQSLETIRNMAYLSTVNVTNMQSMFDYCKNLTELDLHTFNTAKVTNMETMFSDCSQLVTLDISSFNTSNVTSMYYMFTYDDKLEHIYVGDGWNTDNVTEHERMFQYCGKLPNYNYNYLDKAKAHTGDGGYLTALTQIGAWESGDCDVILYSNGRMSVTKKAGNGNGAMANYANKDAQPWADNRDLVTKLDIEDGVKEIGTCAFYDFREMTQLNIHEGVTAIHENAFRNGKKLTILILPSTLKVLGDEADAFTGCPITDIYLTAHPARLTWNEDNDDFIYSFSNPDVHKTTVCHVPANLADAYVVKFITGVEADKQPNVTFEGGMPAVDMITPEDVIALINEIGEVAYTAECKAKIDAAREAYDGLVDEDKEQVTNLTTLTQAEAAYAQLLAQAVAAVKDQIDALPATPLTPENTKLSEYNKVKAAREAYDALTDEEKAAVSNYDKLEAAEEAFAAIPSVGSETVITWDKNTGIEKMSGTATSPAYEGITISIKGGGFGPQDEMLRFNIAGLGLSFEFANTLGGNFQKIVISSTNAMPSTPLAGMGEGWAASSGNKIATWTGDAANVKIWDGLTATSYWDVNTIQFTLGAMVSATEAAQAVKDLIDAIGEVSYPDSKEAIKAAREALDALSDEAKALFATADTAALPQAEAAYAALLAEKVAPVIAAINALPDTPLTDATKKLSEYNKVTDARALYDALTDEEKAAVDNYDKLEAAEAAFAAIGGGGGSAPDGAVSGKFSIDESSVVYFSKGNLQATTADLGANWTWGFAANQWDLIGDAAANNAISGNGTVSANGTVDLFGWSTATTKYGIHNGTNSNISDYAGDFVDWGTTMGEGWFTLSAEQWTYLFNTRTGDKAATVNSVADCRYTKATINTDGTAVMGMILFPDGGTFAASEFTEIGSPNAGNANYTTTCTTAQWNALQAKGCVFLPAAGRRYGAEVSNEDPKGYYWSSSPKPSTDDAYFVFFYPYNVVPASNDFRCLGLSVRLVTEAPASPLAAAQAVKDLIEAIPAEITLDAACVNAVQAARAGYDALDTDAKAILDAADVTKLTDAEADLTALNQAEADKVVAKINAIPTPVELKLATRDSIESARAAYDALTADQKTLVPDAEYQKLLDAETALAEKNPGVPPATPLDSAQAVKDLIGAIRESLDPTEACGAEIAAALNAYDALSDAAKGALDAADVQKLNDAATQYAALVAIAAIEAIPDEITYDPMTKSYIEIAKAKYDALSDASKALVDDEVVAKLTNAEQDWADLVAKIEHNVSYMGKDGELKHETVALLHIPDPAPDFNGYEFVRWDVKAGDFLEEGLRVKAVYTPIITTNPMAYDTLEYNGLAQELVIAGVAKEGHIEYSLYPEEPESWSANLPTATNAAAYVVYYKLVREGHEDYMAGNITVVIAKTQVSYTAPVAYDTLVYNYNMQTLIEAGITNDGIFEYTLTPGATDSWNVNLPQAQDAGTYAVYYRVIGDINHFDSTAVAPVAVTIAKRDIVVEAPVAYDTLVYNAAEQTLVIAGSADFNVMEYSLDTTVQNCWSIELPKAVTADPYTVYYRVPGDDNHNEYEAQSIAAFIAQAPLTITAEDSTIIYGDAVPEFIATYSGWQGQDDETVVSNLAFSCAYQQGSYIGTYAINPNSATAHNYAITFVDGTLTVNKAHVYVSGAEAQIAKFADGHANAVVLEQGILNGIKLNDPIAHVTTAAFSSADVAENLTITLFYELTGDAALLNNYNLDPTSDIFTTEGVIIEPFIPDDQPEEKEDEEAKVEEGIEIYAYGYCDGSGYSLKYHLESGNPDQYKIDFADSRFTDVDWTSLVITGKDGTIDIDIPVDMPTGDYTMTVYFRDSRFDWLESRQFNVTFHINLPETYVRPLFDNVIALVDTCHCLTDIQWYWRANSTDLWQPIEGANGYYYHVDGKLTGEYFVSAKMNGEPTYTCGQTDMETLYGDDNKAQAPVVRAYPNPVINTTTVTIEYSAEWNHNIRIVNLMGVEVMNDTFEGNETNVEMSGYPQGNYMISVDGIVVKVMKK